MTQLKLPALLGAALLMSYSGCTRHPPSSSDTKSNMPLANVGQPVRVSPEDADAAEPAVAAGPDGTVYVAWVEHRENKHADAWLARIDSDGHPKGTPVRINPKPGDATAWRGDPPTVVVTQDSSVYVGWTARVETESGSAADLYLSSSHDGGHTFAAPVRVNDDPKPGVHGMHSLAVAKDGRVYLAWLDERNVTPVPMKDMKTPANSSGHHMESNREVFLAFSTDGGRTFAPNKRIATDVCPCCKTALAIAPDERLYVSWRQVLPGDLRHIAVSSSADQGKTFTKPVIVSDDQWVLAGCPVSGATMAVDNRGMLRVLWYSAGKNGQTGLYWTESSDNGATFAPRRLAAPGTTSGTPVLLANDDQVTVLWQTQNGAPKVMLAHLASGNSVPPSQAVVGDGELPSGAASGVSLSVAYIVKNGDRRSVWLVPAK
jgi:hypothetical protein